MTAPGTKIPVSVIIITRNESARLAACLEKLSAFDEVIVVDSLSTDDTCAIARAMGAVVVPFDWNGHYPKKRQWCLENVKTRHDWIFFLDADEDVTPDNVLEIAGLDFKVAGYFMRGAYVWNGRLLRHGLKNNKLVLLNRHKFEYPQINDLDLPMGEIEGHYQPVLRMSCRGEAIGQLASESHHHAAHSPAQWLARHQRYAVWESGMNARKAWPADPVPVRQCLKTLFRSMPFRGEIAFLHSYILKQGFRDGRAGFDFACHRALYYRLIEKTRHSGRVLSEKIITTD